MPATAGRPRAFGLSPRASTASPRRAPAGTQHSAPTEGFWTQGEGSTPKHPRSHDPSVARPAAEQGVREGSARQGHDDHQPSTTAKQSAKGLSGRRPGDTLAANTWTHLSCLPCHQNPRLPGSCVPYKEQF